ncbi:hypothetical protein [Streptomyces sp. MZ04]|nr:hypothetical protein [Streptomyces sp. MZ04]
MAAASVRRPRRRRRAHAVDAAPHTGVIRALVTETRVADALSATRASR